VPQFFWQFRKILTGNGVRVDWQPVARCPSVQAQAQRPGLQEEQANRLVVMEQGPAKPHAKA